MEINDLMMYNSAGLDIKYSQKSIDITNRMNVVVPDKVVIDVIKYLLDNNETSELFRSIKTVNKVYCNNDEAAKGILCDEEYSLVSRAGVLKLDADRVRRGLYLFTANRYYNFEDEVINVVNSRPIKETSLRETDDNLTIDTGVIRMTIGNATHGVCMQVNKDKFIEVTELTGSMSTDFKKLERADKLEVILYSLFGEVMNREYVDIFSILYGTPCIEIS